MLSLVTPQLPAHTAPEQALEFGGIRDRAA